MRWIYLLSIVILFSGCEIDTQKAQMMQERAQQDTQKPPTSPQEQQLEHKNEKELLKLQHQLALEQEALRNENALAMQQLQLQANQEELEIRQQLAKQEAELAMQTHEQNIEFYKLALIVLAAIALFIALIIYLIARKKSQTKQKMHEDKLKAEYELKQQEFYHQRVNKLLEIAASKESDEQIKKDAIKMIKNDHTLRRLDFKND